MGVTKRPPPQNSREAKKQGFAWVRLHATDKYGASLKLTGPFTDAHAAIIVAAALAKDAKAAKRMVAKCGKIKKCRKLAPFVCPKCGRIDCQTDHWDMPGGWCCHCGEQNCPKTLAQHRKRCKHVAGHHGKCKA